MPNDFTAEVVTLYCLCDDFLRAWGHRDDPQAKMSTAEVMTVALVAAARFGGNQETSRLFLKGHGYIRHMLSKGRLNRRLHSVPEAAWLNRRLHSVPEAAWLNRRLHSVPEAAWQGLLWVLGQAAQRSEAHGAYIVDSCPVPVCANIRIRRCRLYRGERHRGYCASKRAYYYGLKVHLLVTATGRPVEFVLTPASEADIAGLRRLPLDLAPGARVVADAAYTDYAFEDALAEEGGITLTAARRGNSRRPHPAWLSYWCQQTRHRIETTFSTLTGWMGRRLHAVTPRGFELKVALTVLAYSILA